MRKGVDWIHLFLYRVQLGAGLDIVMNRQAL
jgi:hypothetical protein